jgi:hypothetical protein
LVFWRAQGFDTARHFQEIKRQRVPLMVTRAVTYWKDRQKVEKPTTPVKNNLL